MHDLWHLALALIKHFCCGLSQGFFQRMARPQLPSSWLLQCGWVTVLPQAHKSSCMGSKTCEGIWQIIEC